MKKTVNRTVNLDLEGINGNAFLALEIFKRQAQKEGWTKLEIDTVVKEAHRLKDYNHMLATVESHCEVKTEDQ